MPLLLPAQVFGYNSGAQKGEDLPMMKDLLLDNGWQNGRFQTMSLQTFPNNKKDLDIYRQTNRLDDIKGAQHEDRWIKYNHKPNLFDIDDIPGTKSITLHKTMTKKLDRMLCVDDIDGAKPRRRTFITNRMVDPLNPKYKLPTVIKAAPPSLKFIRDTLTNQDIEGTAPKPLFPWQVRENYQCSDIVGASPGWKPRHKRAGLEGRPRDIMCTADIAQDEHFHSHRQTDPLDPVYDINGMQIRDDPIKSKPKRLARKNNCPFYSLVTEDIEGAKPGWVAPQEIRPMAENRRQWRNTNFVGDITGAQADTVVHSIRTERHVNPLNPTYLSLDGKTLAISVTPSYKDPAAIEAIMASQVAVDRAEAAKRAVERVQEMQTKGATKDPRDKVIQQLEAEVQHLRHQIEGGERAMHSPAAVITTKNAFTQAAAAAVSPPASPPVASISPSLFNITSQEEQHQHQYSPSVDSTASSRYHDNNNNAPSTPAAFVAPRPAMINTSRRSTSAGGFSSTSLSPSMSSARDHGSIFLRSTHSSGSNSSGARRPIHSSCSSSRSKGLEGKGHRRDSSSSIVSERMILRSSDGGPRVALNTAELEAARVTAADIQAVHQLS